MNVQPLSAEQWWLIVAVLAALYVTSWIFNMHIDREADLDPEGAGSALLVVFGVSYTLVGVALVLWIVFGVQATLWVMVCALVCFIASGLPMIFGDRQRNLRRRNAYHTEIQQRTQEQTEQHIKELAL